MYFGRTWCMFAKYFRKTYRLFLILFFNCSSRWYTAMGAAGALTSFADASVSVYWLKTRRVARHGSQRPQDRLQTSFRTQGMLCVTRHQYLCKDSKLDVSLVTDPSDPRTVFRLHSVLKVCDVYTSSVSVYWLQTGRIPRHRPQRPQDRLQASFRPKGMLCVCKRHQYLCIDSKLDVFLVTDPSDPRTVFRLHSVLRVCGVRHQYLCTRHLLTRQ